MAEMDFYQSPLLVDFTTYLFWPTDAEKRKAYSDFFNEQTIDWVEKGAEASLGPFAPVFANPEDFVNHRKKMWEQIWTDRDSLRKSLMDYSYQGLKSEIQKSVPKMFMAGQITLCLETMIRHHAIDERLRDGPSLTKAQWVVGKGHNVSDTTITQVWRRFKSVSHFLAAIIAVSGDDSMNNFAETIIRVHENLEVFPYSEFYRSVLESYIPHGQNDPVGASLDLWLLPKNWEVPKIPVVVGPLPEEMLNYVSSRKVSES